MLFQRQCLLSVTTLLLISSKIAECGTTLMTCSPPDAPEDGRVVGTPTIQTPRGLAYSIGDTVRFACNPGFGLAGADEAICLGDGQFSEDPPFCAAITCKRPQVENGVVSANVSGPLPPPGVYRAGTTVILRCNVGFTMVPPDGRMSKCQDSGQWSPNLASCKHAATRCLAPPTPLNAQVVNQSPGTETGDTSFVPGSFIEYRCNEGFETTDSEQIVCLMDGIWSENPPACSQTTRPTATCNSFVLQNGQVTPEKRQYSVGDTATLTCNDGNVITPMESVFLMCIDGGQWSPGIGTCIPRPTTSIRKTTVRGIVTTGVPVETRPYFPGLQPQATTTLKPVTRCPPVRVQFGDIWPNDLQYYEVGTMITLFCQPGFKVTPSDLDYSMCQTSGTWYPAVGACLPLQPTTPGSSEAQRNITCPLPDAPPNTRIVLARQAVAPPGSSLFSVGARLVYGCDEGYYLTDDYHQDQTPAGAPIQIAIECQENGNWSHSPPVCRFNENNTVPVLDAIQVTELFKRAYWNSFNTEPSGRYRACAWGGVAEVLPDPDNRFQAIVVCSSGSVVAVSSNCSSSSWRAVIGPPPGIIGWSQDPFYAADLDPTRRELYLTSSVKKLGILHANLDVIIAAGLRGATVQPQYLVAGTKNGPQYEGIVVDSESRLIYSADSSVGRISAWSLIGGWPFAKIERPESLNRVFQPRHLALSAPGGRQNRRLLALADYVNSQLMVILVNRDNISQSEFAGTIASYSGRCESGSIGRPGRITFDPAGNLLVADGGCGRAQIFAADSVTGRQPYASSWVSKNFNIYLGSIVPLLGRGIRGDTHPIIMAGLSSGEVVCFG